MNDFYSPIFPAPASEDFDDEMNRIVALNPQDITKYPQTDIGAGIHFADFYENCLCYASERKSWFYYEKRIIDIKKSLAAKEVVLFDLK